MSGFSNVVNTVAQNDFNRDMSSVRECVEWAYGEVVQFLEVHNLKFFLSPVASHYALAVLFTNLKCCAHGNKTSTQVFC